MANEVASAMRVGNHLAGHTDGGRPSHYITSIYPVMCAKCASVSQLHIRGMGVSSPGMDKTPGRLTCDKCSQVIK